MRSMRFSYTDGRPVLSQADERDVIELIRAAGASTNPDEMKAIASLVAQPINLIADYEGFANKVFVPKQVQVNEDWAIPIQQHNVLAYLTTLDGQVRRTRSGLQWVRPDFTTIGSGFELDWNTLKRATWDLMGEKLGFVGQEIARMRDQLAFNVIMAAANSVNHVVNTTGGVMTRASVDAIFKQAAAIRWPIRRVIANTATLQDHRTTGFFTWDTNRFPIATGDSGLVNEIMNKGYLGKYAGADWFETSGLSSGTTLGTVGGNLAAVATGTAVVLYIGEPASFGYDVQMGEISHYSDINMDKRTNRHAFEESRFYYCGNAYTVWVQLITAT